VDALALEDVEVRVSIWQQFSSNHSNDFTLIGEFETTDEAEQIAKRLLDMLRAIRADHDAQPVQPLEMDEPTQTEIRYGQLYGVEWVTTLDWIAEGEALNAQVVHYDNLVFVDSLGAAWNPFPLDELLDQWGKRVLVETAMGDNSIVADVHCLVPDPEPLVLALDTYLKAREKGYQTGQWMEIDPPWLPFGTPVSAPGLRENAVYHVWQGSIEESSMHLHLSNLFFLAPGYGLPALIAYLKVNGGTDIQYNLYERPDAEVRALVYTKQTSLLRRFWSALLRRG
jgi:hypothetical protein